MPEYMPTKKIREVIEMIEESQWILPTFQRKYVWDQEQICDLFDSIMRSYPISTSLLRRYRVRYEEIIDYTP